MAKEKTIAAVTLRTDRPTRLHFADIFAWVIWQFPRPHEGSFYGAVRPPVADHGWLPALINGDSEELTVHGQVERKFKSPEAAADWLAESLSKPAGRSIAGAR